MSLLGLVASIRIAGGPDRCIRICTQFLVTDRVKSLVVILLSLVASGLQRFAVRDHGGLRSAVIHKQVSIGMVGK